MLPADAATSCSSSTTSPTTHGTVLTPLPLHRGPTSSTVPAKRSAPLQARLWLQDQDLASPAPCTTIKPWLIRSGKLGQAVYQARQPASGSELSISSVPTLAACSLALSHGCSSFNIPTHPWPQPSCPQTDGVRATLNQSRSPHASSFELSSLHGGPRPLLSQQAPLCLGTRATEQPKRRAATFCSKRAVWDPCLSSRHRVGSRTNPIYRQSLRSQLPVRTGVWAAAPRQRTHPPPPAP